MTTLTIDLILRLLFGCVVLLAGRNIFWLFIGLVGFLVGAELADVWLAGQPAWLIMAAAIGIGLIGALLAIFFERVAFALAGFYAGVYLTMALSTELGFAGIHPAIVFVVGAVGALVAALVMDWAIIVLSALAGAAAVVSTLALPTVVKTVVFLVLAVIGIAVQRAVLDWRQRA